MCFDCFCPSRDSVFCVEEIRLTSSLVADLFVGLDLLRLLDVHAAAAAEGVREREAEVLLVRAIGLDEAEVGRLGVDHAAVAEELEVETQRQSIAPTSISRNWAANRPCSSSC